MRVKKHPGPWTMKIVRVTQEHRRVAIEIATTLGVSTDGVLRLALRAYARARGVDLPQWRHVLGAARPPLTCQHQDEPKLWLRLRPSWPAILAPLAPDEGGRYRSDFAGTVRAAIIEFYAAGPAEWARVRNTAHDEPIHRGTT